MDRIAAGPAENRERLFADTVELHEEVELESLVEKDFWVCWILHRLFHLDGLIPLVFKGGTSLSKAYGAIHRFSEDLDLSLDRSGLGFTGDDDPARAPSRKRSERLLSSLDNAASEYLEDELMPSLSKDIRSVLGPDDGSYPWKLEVMEEEELTWQFVYPPTSFTPTTGSYTAPRVILEFGARSDHTPQEDREITPYAAEVLQGEFLGPSTRITTLAVERTYWEKLTLLHMLASGGVEKLRPRMARHYYDVCMLDREGHTEDALDQIDLLEVVAAHKKVFFRSAWAKYEEARPGTLRLVPATDLADGLRSDYASMGELFFGSPPSFDEILAVLQELEERINDRT